MTKLLFFPVISVLLQLHFAGTEADVFSSALNTVSGMFGSGDRKASWTESQQLFQQDMAALERQFPHQTRDTWLQLLSTIENTLNLEPPRHPAVITALIPPTVSTEFGECFVSKVALTLNKATADIFQRSQPSNPLALSNITFERKSITQIRSEVESYLNTRGKAIVVSGIDHFQNEHDLLVFHGLCDNYHAVDARATLLFPVSVPENIYEKFKNKWRHDLGGTISHEVLTEAWKSVVGSNVGPALIARVADAVILLNPEDSCKLSSLLIDEEESLSDINPNDYIDKEKTFVTKEDVENIVKFEITKFYNMLHTQMEEKQNAFELKFTPIKELLIAISNKQSDIMRNAKIHNARMERIEVIVVMMLPAVLTMAVCKMYNALFSFNKQEYDKSAINQTAKNHHQREELQQ